MREPQLDGLRAVAIVAVLYSHFWYADTYVGSHGVRLFFVLSGFLITRILLGIKEQSWGGLRGFYARRAVRIWPIYYLTLLTVGALDIADSRPSLPWHALFLSNFWYAFMDPENPWPLAHLWSLSVEEQFYLIWPAVVLLVPTRWLGVVCWSLILLAIPYRVWAAHGDMAGYFVFDAVDALAVGALLAVRATAGARVNTWLWWPGVIALLIAVSVELLRLSDASWVWPLLASGLLLLFAPLVEWASRGALPGGLGTGLSARPVAGLGRISYGTYLYHLPLYAVLIKLGDVVGVPVERGPVVFAVGGALTIAIAAVSWNMIERPLLERLPHRPKVLAPSFKG